MTKKVLAPKKVKCDRRKGKFYLPETEIEVPKDLAGIVYPLKAIRINPANPRKTLDLETLIAGIRRFGFRDPIVVNSRTMEIEAGHQRKAALKKLGVRYAPMVLVDDDDLTAAAFNISSNRTQEITAIWDDGALQKIYDTLKAEDSLVGVGFDDKSLSEMKLHLTNMNFGDGDGSGGGEGEGGSGAGGGNSGEPPDPEFKIIVDCDNEEHQTSLLEVFEKEGYSCRALIL